MKFLQLHRSLVKKVAFLGLVSVMSCVGFVYTRPNPENQQARITINRTNQVLQDAQNSVRGTRVYTGNLAFAYYNQRYAVDLYNNGQYHNAIEYSLYSRRLCYQALQSNGVRYPAPRYQDESQFRARDDSQLKADLLRAYPDQRADDQTALTFSLNFNVQ